MCEVVAHNGLELVGAVSKQLAECLGLDVHRLENHAIEVEEHDLDGDVVRPQQGGSVPWRSW